MASARARASSARSGSLRSSRRAPVMWSMTTVSEWATTSWTSRAICVRSDWAARSMVCACIARISAVTASWRRRISPLSAEMKMPPIM